jgi:hypothetical protein
MPGMPKKLGLPLMAVAALLSFSVIISAGECRAEKYEVFGDKTLVSAGYLRQKVQAGVHDPEMGSNYQLDGTDKGIISVVTTFETENQLELSSNTEFAFTFRWETDNADSFQSGREWNRGSGLAWDKFRDSNDIPYDAYLDDMVRALSFAYSAKYFSFRIGKQQLGWGEADGLRLMNNFMGLDMRKDFILRDSDNGYSESNIPLWMVKTDFTPGFSFGSELGFQNLDLELDWSPDEGNNASRFAVGPRNGGPWAFPLPNLPLPLSQLTLTDNRDDFNFDDGSYGARLKGVWHDIFFTINGYVGWSKSFFLGHSENYTGLGNVGLVPFGFVGNVADATNDLSFLGIPPAAGLGGLSLTLDKEFGRSKFFGFTASREIPIKAIAHALGQYTYPVIRVEALYDKDVAFNIGVDNRNTAIFSDWIWYNHKEKRDIYRYLIGLDWNLHAGFINPNDDVWLSAQFSQNRIDGSLYSKVPTAPGLLGYPGGEPQRLQYAPYFWFPKNVETFTSLLLKSDYMDNNLHCQVLYVHDWTYSSYWIKPKVILDIGSHWRWEVGGYIIEGDRERQMGIFENLDSVYTMLTFQW